MRRPYVVISGSYHQNPSGLRQLFDELDETCRILSPISVDFTDTSVDVVRAPQEANLTHLELQRFHLRAIRSAGFLALHAPLGYLGDGGKHEVGYAHALHIPIFSLERPTDEVAAMCVRIARSVPEMLEQFQLIGPQGCPPAQV